MCHETWGRIPSLTKVSCFCMRRNGCFKKCACSPERPAKLMAHPKISFLDVAPGPCVISYFLQPRPNRPSQRRRRSGSRAPASAGQCHGLSSVRLRFAWRLAASTQRVPWYLLRRYLDPFLPPKSHPHQVLGPSGR